MTKVDETVDVAIVGAGIGGLAAGAILNTLYNKRVGVYESHYLPGGCAHAFQRSTTTTTTTTTTSSTSSKKDISSNSMTFTFDSGPTILLGCSQKPFNALRQVLDAIGQSVEWIRYDGWGMIEWPQGTSSSSSSSFPSTSSSSTSSSSTSSSSTSSASTSSSREKPQKRWKCELGPHHFQQGPLREFGGVDAVVEFEALRAATKDLVVGAAIPAMAMRPGPLALVPLLRYFSTLWKLIQQGNAVTGTFGAYMDGPSFQVKNGWLRNWLDALAFSLSGLPASRTSAAAMAFVLDDMHREGAALDYPQGGLGSVIDALVRGLEEGGHGSKLHLRSHVRSIDFSDDGSRAIGLTLEKNGRRILARDGVICNAPLWSLRNLIHNEKARCKLMANNGHENVVGADDKTANAQPQQSWFAGEDGYSIHSKRPAEFTSDSGDGSINGNLLKSCDTAEMTGSFLHLHVAIDATGLDLSQMEAHYTVMDRGLEGSSDWTVNGVPDGPCGEINMIAVSNPCVIDPTLAPKGYMVLHAYGAGNEPYGLWKDMKRSSVEYQQLKEERSQVLWRAMESIIPDIRKRVVLDLTGSPLTHERFLRRPNGTYGVATEDYLKDGSTPISNLILANDGVFPGIGLPAVAIAGASAANGLVNPLQQWTCLDLLKKREKIA